jgi:AcrR family transcriptional regulator
MTSTQVAAGLRERKKRRTREALIDAAINLFRSKGFEATTIDEIAEAVEVSPRTFFRYFDSKEDVALSLIDQQFTSVYAAFAARPPAEPVLRALRHAVVDMMRAYESGTAGYDTNRYSCAQQLLKDSHAVHARSLELCTIRLADLAAHVAARMGVPATDARPTLVAAVVTTAIQTAIVAWREAEPEVNASVLAERAFALLEEGINYPSAGARPARA